MEVPKRQIKLIEPAEYKKKKEKEYHRDAKRRISFPTPSATEGWKAVDGGDWGGFFGGFFWGLVVGFVSAAILIGGCLQQQQSPTKNYNKSPVPKSIKYYLCVRNLCRRTCTYVRENEKSDAPLLWIHYIFSKEMVNGFAVFQWPEKQKKRFA